jgi:oligopeptidase A
MFPKFPENPLSNGFERVEKEIEKNREEIEKLLQIEQKNYSNFIAPLNDLDRNLDEIFTPIYHLHSVNNSEQSREVYEKILPILSEYGTEVSQNLDIFRATKSILESDKTLNLEQKKVLEDSLLDFQLSGAELPEEKKDLLKEINLKLSQLSNSFSQNLLDATNSFEMVVENFEDVKEIPESDRKIAETEDGKWKFSLQMPSYLAYLTYGTNRELREKMYRAYTTRSPENSEVIDQILRLKSEKASILGFSSHAEKSLRTKMAESPEKVIQFLEDLAEKSRDRAEEELEEIRKYSELEDFQSFDLALYSERYRKENLDLDEELYRPYFEKSGVTDGLFKFLYKLFQIEFKKVDEKLWHEKAETFYLYENGEVIGRLFLDLEARESKRGGAWMNDWQSHSIDSNGNETLPTAFIVCNFPESTDEIPSLLRHDDVVTLFHEMGHALHHLLSRVNEYPISGTNGVEWDAVEFPSQFLESFAFEREILRDFAKHHQTGETLPEEMIDKLIEAKNFQSALQMVRQLEFGLFDFKLHMKLYSGDKVQELLDSIRDEISPLLPPKYNKFQNGFAHIFAGGYSAGYYSYKWAEVLSADMFYQFVDRGIFDPELAKKYRDTVLGGGGRASMGELFREVSGRESDGKYLLKLSGIEE